MTIANQRKFIDQLMVHTGAICHQELGRMLDLNPSVISKLHHHPKPGMKLSTLAGISARTGIKVSTLAGWLAGEEI